MKINKNDPRLTAYLLNELSNEDRNLVETALRESSEIKEELEKLKKGLGLLHQNTPANDGFYKLTNQQRQQIFDKIAESQPNFWQRFFRGPWGYATAGLVTASFAMMIFNHSLKNQVAQKAEMTKDKIIANEIQKIHEAPPATDDAKPSALSVPASKPSALPSKAIEAEMPLTASVPTESLGTASSSAASAPAPQMEEIVERKKSANSDSFGDAGFTEGSEKERLSSFQKMQKKEFADTASATQTRAGAKGIQAKFTGPSSEFLLLTEPALPQNLREKLHANFQDCLFHPENGLSFFKAKWNGFNLSDIDPSNAVNSTQKSCLEEQLKNTLGSKKDILLIKVNSVSK